MADNASFNKTNNKAQDNVTTTSNVRKNNNKYGSQRMKKKDKERV